MSDAPPLPPPAVPDQGDESFSRIVSPILAGFSLPTIVALATAPISDRVANDISLSCLVASTGLFLASFQLAIGKIYITYRKTWGNLRAGLSFTGILLLIVALVVLVTSVAGHWWVSLALVVLCVGGGAPILLRWWLAARVRHTAIRGRRAGPAALAP